MLMVNLLGGGNFVSDRDRTMYLRLRTPAVYTFFLTFTLFVFTLIFIISLLNLLLLVLVHIFYILN